MGVLLVEIGVPGQAQHRGPVQHQNPLHIGLQHAIEKRVEAQRQLVQPVGRAHRSLRRRGHQLGVCLHEDRLEKCCLGGEVVIQGTGRQPRLAGQVLDRRAAEAALAEEPAARCHQRRARLGNLLGAQRRRLL